MWILMYEIYAGYDLLDFALASAILIASGMACVLLRDIWLDEFPYPASPGGDG